MLAKRHVNVAKSLKLREIPSEKQYRRWLDQMDKNGIKRIQIRRLLRAFGYDRRGPDGVAAKKIQSWFRRTDKIYVRKLTDLSLPLSADAYLSRVKIAPFLSPTTMSERAFCEKYEEPIMKKLDLQCIGREHCPPLAADKFDFLAKDAHGNFVVVEVKRYEGGGHVVEQTMRYIGDLRYAIQNGMLEHDQQVRGVIITNIMDIATHRALMGRQHNGQQDDHIQWWLYGLDAMGRLRMKRVHV